MTEQVKEICRSCLYCWSSHRGDTVPRPFQPTMRPTKVNEIIETDFFKVADNARTVLKAKRGKEVALERG